ncbi:MAG: hypothetical protein GY861_06630 [bacterium]|nr:hypothetical protein [bacterium]
MKDVVQAIKDFLKPPPVEPDVTIIRSQPDIEHTCMRLKIRLEELQPQIEAREVQHAKEVERLEAQVTMLKAKLAEVTKMLIQTGETEDE